MIKSEYLAQSDVESFIGWFAQHLSTASPLSHRYTMPGNVEIQFANLAGALAGYQWDFPALAGVCEKGSSLAENGAALALLQERLRDAVVRGHDADARDAAIAVMAWGGVKAGNENWLRRNEKGLAALLRQVAETLQKDDDNAELFGQGLRFNAGMTKVYSLLLDNFIIYDSRVAAALAWFVMTWVREKKIAAIPEALNFPCMPAKEGANAEIRKLRNPGVGKREFQKMNNHPVRHAQWNLHASWIIEAAVNAAADSAFSAEPAPMRAVEAALFMWGYDLGKNSPWLADPEEADSDSEFSEPGVANVPASLVASLYQTRGDQLPFNWRLDEEDDKIVIQRANGKVDEFTVTEAFCVLHTLDDRFGENMIPLANNVQKVKNRTEKDGLGKAIYDLTGDVTRAQAASYFGPIMEELKIFGWNKKRKGIEFFFTPSPPASIQALRDLLSEYAA